jgi:hypothetical protein
VKSIRGILVAENTRGSRRRVRGGFFEIGAGIE